MDSCGSRDQETPRVGWRLELKSGGGVGGHFLGESTCQEVETRTTALLGPCPDCGPDLSQ